MDIETKLDLVLKPPTEEVITREDLRNLFETKHNPSHYIGFEASGFLHVGQLLLTAAKLNDFNKAGVKTQIFLADWHSAINKKFGGDWSKIHKACDYFREAFKQVSPATEFVLGSELYKHNDDYWKAVLEFSGKITLARATRCLTILGRTEKETQSLAQYVYPSMQAVDIRFIGADIAHAGMDQRKIHVLAREIFPKMGWKPPISVHHHLLKGLGEPQHLGLEENKQLDTEVSSKMSKSKPETAIFIHDSQEDITRKLEKAYCPPTAERNPVLDFARYLVFSDGKALEIERPAKYGGTVSFQSYAELEAAYIDKKLHASDLKRGVALAIDEIVAPVREHFESNKHANDLYRAVKSFDVTR
ncbi:MAG TPA: tyrosine--tRNA ligase [Candidatus Norongarragalinales archaeon]|jgi:tyrosyl-tRNA synthetase|nr:tyrosine--tRNA ligase [Candidatus Norongarragalinales archaeon]